MQNELTHASEPLDRILNLAQLRNAGLMDVYRPSRTPADRNNIVRRALRTKARLDTEKAEESARKLEKRDAKLKKRPAPSATSNIGAPAPKRPRVAAAAATQSVTGRTESQTLSSGTGQPSASGSARRSLQDLMNPE